RYTRGFPRLVNIVCDNVLLAAYTDDAKQVSANLVKKVVSDLEKTYGKGSVHVPVPRVQRRRTARRVVIRYVVPTLALLALAFFAWALLDRIDTGSVRGWIGMERKSAQAPDGSSGISGAVRRLSSALTTERDTRDEGQPRVSLQDQTGEDSAAVPPSLTEPQQGSGVTVTVGPHDTIAQLAARQYGRVDPGILNAVRKANPAIGNIDLVFEGQKVFLPGMHDPARVMFTVSVASYHSIHEATAVFVDLVKKGFQATIYPYLDSRGNTWYRITIGTYVNQNEAKSSAQQLKAKGFFYAKPVKVSLEG
ncbi:MAG: SPOR domain-containing protein, partial [Deltaproteobacteria bacterium]|nr:SPOR domain-containing protein [Deltaproteobacteria bacterium]